MNDKEKQIEEMAKDKLIKVILQSGGLTINMFGRGERIVRADVDKLANNLIESGLIIPKDSVVLTREEFENLKFEIQKAHNKGVQAGFDMTTFKEHSIKNQASKETAKEIFETLLLFLVGETFTVGKELKKVRKKIIKMAEEMGVDMLYEELF